MAMLVLRHGRVVPRAQWAAAGWQSTDESRGITVADPIDGGSFFQWRDATGTGGVSFLYDAQTMKVTAFPWRNDSLHRVAVTITFGGQTANVKVNPGTSGTVNVPAGLVSVAPDLDGTIFPVGIGYSIQNPAA